MNRLLVILYFVVAIAFLFAKFFLHHADLEILAFFEDDFFYYLETSKNFILYGFPSVDLQTPTNGYHPLWFIIITILQIPSKNPYYLMLMVTIITFISLLVSFLYTNKIYYYYSNSVQISNYLSIITTSLFLIYFAQGMEIVLLFPLITILIYYLITEKDDSLAIGLLFNIIFLSRLDSVILLFLIFIYFVVKKRSIVLDYKFYIPFGLSFAYILSNIIFFDTLLPISGLAKQLKTSYLPIYNAVNTIFILQRDRIIYGLVPFIFFVVNYILLIRYSKQEFRLLFILINTFPFLFSLYNVIFSGWWFWSWYYYIFYPSIIIFFILIVQTDFFIKYLRKFLPLSAILIILFFFNFIKRSNDISKTLLYENAIKVAEFEKENPGIYAMGDKAGLVSYLIESPVVHLEGLVMDKKYISVLKTTPKLLDILEKYKVDFYIANNAKKIDEGYFVEEPTKNHRYMITSADTIDITPIIVEDTHGWQFQIFDLRKK